MLLYYGDNASADAVDKLTGCFSLWSNYGMVVSIYCRWQSATPSFEARYFQGGPMREFVNLPQKSHDRARPGAVSELLFIRMQDLGRNWFTAPLDKLATSRDEVSPRSYGLILTESGGHQILSLDDALSRTAG